MSETGIETVHPDSTAEESFESQEELNLSGVYEFCERHGGKFWNRKNNRGAAVSILLPVSPAPETVTAGFAPG